MNLTTQELFMQLVENQKYFQQEIMKLEDEIINQKKYQETQKEIQKASQNFQNLKKWIEQTLLKRKQFYQNKMHLMTQEKQINQEESLYNNKQVFQKMIQLNQLKKIRIPNFTYLFKNAVEILKE